jgi:acetyl-CoA carboxylase carboxyl transferase subunit beta
MRSATVPSHSAPLPLVAFERRRPRPSGSVQRAPQYHLVTIEPRGHAFLKPVFEAFACRTLDVWVEAGAGFERQQCDGLVTGLAACDGRRIAVVWSDFRHNAASYGRANSRRFASFLAHLRLDPEPIPLVFVVNSAGLSLMEGRTAFSDVFRLWPELLDYASDRLLLTCAVGKCLGVAPLLYGLGQYRVAVAGRTQVNLTGPEVIRLFFGAGHDFEQRAAAERCVERHDLVHDLVPSVAAALALFRRLIARDAGAENGNVAALLGVRTGALVARFLDGTPRELVPGWCPRVRLLLGARHGRPLGVFVNPLERSNNMITVRTLEKYAAGLDLFRALRVPIVSLLDSPGIDPRFDESDANNLRTILRVGEKIIRYPYRSMGVVAGRCFGGATTLAFPKVFGGSRALALRGTQIGVMHDRIVDQVLAGAPRLLAQWQERASARRADFSDLLADGTLDAVVEPDGLAGEIDRFLAS